MATPVIVVSGIVWRGDLLLIAQRKNDSNIAPNKWEFPGGKLEPGEEEKVCAAREIKEELGLEIRVGELYATNQHIYDLGDREFHMDFRAYDAQWVSGEIQLLDCQDARWIYPRQLKKYDFAPADIPIVEKLLKEYRA